MKNLISLRNTLAIKRSAETVKNMTEDICLAISTKYLCHIGHGTKRFLGYIDITIFTYTILLLQNSIIYVHVTCVSGTAHDIFEILVGDNVSCKMLRCKVKHHRQRRVNGQINALAAVFLTETCPIILFNWRFAEWQILRCNICD